MLRIKKQRLYEWVHYNRIPYVKTGRFLRFRKEQIDQWMKENQKGFDYYEESEARKFLNNCSGDFYPVACCAVYTGMRAGEIVVIKRKDVDLERKIIRVASEIEVLDFGAGSSPDRPLEEAHA
jgi:excisionase family DNA binding protein